MTPDTNAYLLLGLAVVVGVLLFYVASLTIRLRNAGKAAAIIRQLLAE